MRRQNGPAVLPIGSEDTMPLLHAALGWNYVLVTALCGSFLAQFIKVILNLFIFHRFIPERMWGAGGMPSSHSATVCAMVVATGRYCGVTSTEFALAAVVSIIVMYDAMCVADREPEITRKECDELMEHYFGIWTFVIYVKKYTDKIAGVFGWK